MDIQDAKKRIEEINADISAVINSVDLLDARCYELSNERDNLLLEVQKAEQGSLDTIRSRLTGKYMYLEDKEFPKYKHICYMTGPDQFSREMLGVMISLSSNDVIIRSQTRIAISDRS